jgi:hypothetical protein
MPKLSEDEDLALALVRDEVQEVVERGIARLRRHGPDEDLLDFMRAGWMASAKLVKSSKDIHELMGTIMTAERHVRDMALVDGKANKSNMPLGIIKR